MRVRALDSLGDWTFGKGLNDYKFAQDAIAQNIQTRVSSFLGDCFFATNEGIDWWNLLGAKDQTALNLAIVAMILNTEGVLSNVQTFINLDANRLFSVSYKVRVETGVIDSDFSFSPTDYLVTQDDDILITEGGDPIVV